MSGTSVFVKPAAMVAGSIFERDETARFVFPLHKHDDVSEILLIVEGKGAFVVDGGNYTVGAGSLLLYHRGVWHEETSVEHPFKAMYIGFRGLEIRGLPPGCLLDPRQPPVVPLREHLHAVKQQFYQTIIEFQQSAPEARLIANHMLGILFARLSRFLHYSPASAFPNKPSLPAVPFAKRYMEEHYRENISLKTLAAVTFVSEYHLAHLFKNETGCSPIQYLIRYRMEVAKHYLKTTAWSVRDIAEAVGYRSETSFYNLFRSVSGMTPAGYRERCKSE